jgi:hypothetical protein
LQISTKNWYSCGYAIVIDILGHAAYQKNISANNNILMTKFNFTFIALTLISLSIFGQESQGKFIADKRTGCKVWDPYYSSDDSITWIGSCKNKTAEGFGTLTWFVKGKQEAQYIGIMQNGIPNGKGRYSYADGFSQDGYFLGGEFLNLSDPYFKLLQKNTIPIVDSTDIFVNDGDSKALFYFALVPKDSIKGTLILLPSTYEKPEEVFNNNIKLNELASDNHLLIIIPSINYNPCLNAVSLNFLNTAFSDMLKKYNPPQDKIIIGGFSLGGMNALRYSEMALENNSTTVIKPKAVYAVDPPLDYAQAYYTALRLIEKNFSEISVNEAKSGIEKANSQFGGTPDKFPEIYVQYSPYSRSEKNGGNAALLKNIPVRIYCDPDINWWMKNRRMDYYDMNALNQTAMINQLNILGNDKAEFINALGKGYRIDGTRHPHSWSIVDADDCINWIKKCLQ